MAPRLGSARAALADPLVSTTACILQVISIEVTLMQQYVNGWRTGRMPRKSYAAVLIRSQPRRRLLRACRFLKQKQVHKCPGDPAPNRGHSSQKKKFAYQADRRTLGTLVWMSGIIIQSAARSGRSKMARDRVRSAARLVGLPQALRLASARWCGVPSAKVSYGSPASSDLPVEGCHPCPKPLQHDPREACGHHDDAASRSVRRMSSILRLKSRVAAATRQRAARD